ncbi:hypothetical protein DB42_BN00520 [Neochlamydia sp. EPS4]|uniref:hypothetical protein n=1 Tax=Neochlamydia sp. EPS4 TaxID=1478175 RepID=UPI00058370FE|nr:hypothetical protein [Neochlamydia sp. EPS4]KIC73989.1 hypothetical protein DB42_BN00520 [Neochlamydia sp. EPS4]
MKKEYEATEKKTIKEILDAYSKLHTLLDEQNLTEVQAIQERISSIGSVLEFQDSHIFAMPPYYEIAYDRLKNLCYRLLERGHSNTVKQFGELIVINKFLVDPKPHEVLRVAEISCTLFPFHSFKK